MAARGSTLVLPVLSDKNINLLIYIYHDSFENENLYLKVLLVFLFVSRNHRINKRKHNFDASLYEENSPIIKHSLSKISKLRVVMFFIIIK